MNAANTVTALRIALVPVFGVLWWRGAHGWALAVFVAAGLSDILDGLLARMLNQRTRLGQFLDPAADKLMLLVSFLIAAAVGALPRWVVALIIGRDVVQAIVGGIAWYFARKRFGPDHWVPTRLGKYAAFIQVILVGLSLLSGAIGSDELRRYVTALSMHAAVLTVVAGVQYLAAAASALFPARLADGGPG